MYVLADGDVTAYVQHMEGERLLGDETLSPGQPYVPGRTDRGGGERNRG